MSVTTDNSFPNIVRHGTAVVLRDAKRVIAAGTSPVMVVGTWMNDSSILQWVITSTAGVCSSGLLPIRLVVKTARASSWRLDKHSNLAYIEYGSIKYE